MQAIESNFRCIEIDIWDGPNETPIVTHGNTLCKETQLEIVLKYLKENSFKKTD